VLLEKSQDAQFVYAGYSAGACVMAPTLRGIHLLDDPYFVPEGYSVEPLWDGLAVIPFCIAPHYRSHHPESGMMEEAIAYFIEHKIPFIALRDGEVYARD
jgi:dipeptidase E